MKQKSEDNFGLQRVYMVLKLVTTEGEVIIIKLTFVLALHGCSLCIRCQDIDRLLFLFVILDATSKPEVDERKIM